jgi:hypothetical protein
MVIDKLKSVFTGDLDKLGILAPEFREIYETISPNNKDKKDLLRKIFLLNERYKRLPPLSKQVYWKVVVNRLNLADLEAGFTKIDQVIGSFNSLTSANNPNRATNLNVFNHFNPNRQPQRQADAILLTIKHADEFESLKRDAVNNPESLRILENYKIISNAGFGLNSVQILEEAKLWNETIKNNPNIPEAVIFQILSDLRILPSKLKVHLDAYEKLVNLSGYSAELIAERDAAFSSPDFKSRYVSLLMNIEAKHDLKKKEFKEVYKDSLTDLSFNAAEFSTRELQYSPPEIVKREIMAAKSLYEYLKNPKLSEVLKNQVRLILESGSNYEYGLYQIQSFIAYSEPIGVPSEVINRIMRLAPNISLEKRNSIVNSLRNIEALPQSVKSVAKKLLSKDYLNAVEVYREAVILNRIIVSCYEPVPNAYRRIQLMTLLAYNLKPSEIKASLGL